MKLSSIKIAALGSVFAFAAVAAQAAQVSAPATIDPTASNTSTLSSIKESVKSAVKDTASKIKFNGFLSTGAAVSSSQAPYEIPGHGTVTNKVGYAANSLLGLQMEAQLSDKLSVVAQVVANGNNIDGNVPYRVNAEWAFLKYKPFENLQVRAGRFRMPLFMYSDTLEVGYSYPWIFAPN